MCNCETRNGTFSRLPGVAFTDSSVLDWTGSHTVTLTAKKATRRRSPSSENEVRTIRGILLATVPESTLEGEGSKTGLGTSQAGVPGIQWRQREAAADGASRGSRVRFLAIHTAVPVTRMHVRVEFIHVRGVSMILASS